MSSLKDAADAGSTQESHWGQGSSSSSSSIQSCRAQNSHDMSVTPPVAHVEMWPYVDSAAVASENHAATAVLMLLSVMTYLVSCTGLGVAFGTGSGVGAQASPCRTPHDVDAHLVPANAS